MNIRQAKLALTYLLKSGITPHFIGRHGIGKSAIFYQWAKENDYTVREIRVGLMADAGDLVGIQEFVKHKVSGEVHSTRHVLPDWFMEAVADIENAATEIKDGKKVLIFIDELNRGHKDLLQAIFELVYDHSLKGVKIGKMCGVGAASNPPTDDYAVLDFADSAFQDRFCHIKLEPTLEEWVTYGKASSMENSVVDFISEYPQMLEMEGKPFDLDFVTPSRRSWERVSKIIQAGTPPEIELELVTGIVGMKAALAYRTFRESYIKSIKAEDVLNSYSQLPAVRESVLKAIEKTKTDMLGTLVEELGGLFKKMEGLTQIQADNLGELIHDLPAEHAYALVLVATSSECQRTTMLIDGKSPGLYNHKRFVERVEYIKQKRMEVKEVAKKQEAKKSKKSKEEK